MLHRLWGRLLLTQMWLKEDRNFAIAAGLTFCLGIFVAKGVVFMDLSAPQAALAAGLALSLQCGLLFGIAAYSKRRRSP